MSAVQILVPPEAYSKKRGKLTPDAGAPDAGAILLYAQVRETRRRPKIAEAFFERNSRRYCNDKRNIRLRPVLRWAIG